VRQILTPWLCALAAEGLPHDPDGASTARPPRSVLDDTGWAPRLDEVFAHGLAGLLAHAWDAGRVSLEGPALDRLEARLESEALQGVSLERELLRLAPFLERFGAVVLKGPALAHCAYPDPAWRPFTDLDVLVPARSIPDAVADLGRLGYRRTRPDPSPGYAVRVGKATTLTHETGLVVDLHRTLVAGVVGETIASDDVLRGRQTLWAGAVAVPSPAWSAHLVEVALHAVLGDGLGRALSIRDVAQVAAHPAIVAADVMELTRRWRAVAPVTAGLRAARDALGALLPSALEQWIAETAGAEVSATLAPASARSAATRIEDLHRGGLRRRLTAARALIAPDAAFLRWKYGDHPRPTLYRYRWRELRHRTADARRAS
jgi:Uncharacterised nucleotidyltransferase